MAKTYQEKIQKLERKKSDTSLEDLVDKFASKIQEIPIAYLNELKPKLKELIDLADKYEDEKDSFANAILQLNAKYGINFDDEKE